MPDEVKLLPCEDLSDDKCAICGKHKSRHSTGSGFGMCQIYPLFVSEREMLERLTRAIEVTDEVGEKVAKAIEDADNRAVALVLQSLSDRIDGLEAENEHLRAAISWIEPPFVDDSTDGAELRRRIRFCVADAARAALHQEDIAP